MMPGFAKDENDTTCIPFSQMFIKFINKEYPGLKIIILTVDYPFHAKEYSWQGNHVIPFNGNKYKWFRPLLWIRIYTQLIAIKKKKSLIGLLSFWCAENALVANYFAKWNRYKHFIWLQGQDARENNPVFRYFRPKPHQLIAISEFQKQIFIHNYGFSPKYVIPNSIAAEEFSHIICKKKTIDVIGVGSLISLKRYHLFIETIEKLKPDFPNIRAMLVGNGEQYDYLKELIRKKNLDENICLKGQVSHSRALQLMQEAKILLHPSEYEGYSRVCIEALYLGCQVVSCIYPEKKSIPHWHIVNTVDEMQYICKHILTGDDPGAFFQVKVNMMPGCIQQILALYGYPVANEIKTEDEKLPDQI